MKDGVLIAVIALIMIAISVLLSGLVCWGIGAFVVWAFNINFVWTFWHGIAASLVLGLLGGYVKENIKNEE